MIHVSHREASLQHISTRVGQAVDRIDISEMPRILRRRIWLILAIVAAAMIAATVFLYFFPPRYTSEMAILIGREPGSAPSLQAALVNQPTDEASIISELTVIQSRKLAERVIDVLRLEDDPEFNKALRPENALGWGVRQVAGFLNLPMPNPEHEDLAKQRVVDRFLRHLEVINVPRSRTAVLKFTSARPDTAASVLNELAEQYLLSGLEDSFDNARKSATWLASRTEKLREQVEQAEAAVESYRQQHGLYQTDTQSLIAKQISDLNARLTDAGVEVGAAEAQLAQAQRALASRDEAAAIGQVLRSDLIVKFREEEMLLERKEAEAREQLGPRHPSMIQLRAEQERLQDRIRIEISRVVQGLESEVRVARSREASLRKDLEKLERQMAQMNQASIGLHTLERDAQSKRLLLEKLLVSLNETKAQESVESQAGTARIISAAPIPERPSFPQLIPTLLAALLGSAALGVIVALAVELYDTGFRSAEQLEVETAMPVLALVPRVKHRNPALTVIDRPRSAFAEAVRSIQTRLLLLSPEIGNPKVIQMISSEANEGKSVLAASLARQWAALGRKVLLLDADFRRSQVARMMQLQASPGLSDVLLGEANLDAAIQHDPSSSADVIVAGEQPIERLDLGNRKLKGLIEQVREQYDFIVIDSPPSLAPADAEVIAGVADSTVMVVRWGQTRRGVVRYSLDKIGKFGGSVHACVLSMVDLKKHASYSYGDSSAYYQLPTDVRT